MFSLLTALTLLAAPTGFTEKAAKDECTVYVGPTLATGYSKVDVECAFTSLSVSKLDALLTAVGDHDVIFGTIAESTVLGEANGAKRVRQRHVNPGISDREVVMLMGRQQKGDAIQHWWRKDADQSEVSGDNVMPDDNNGYWLIQGRADGGTDLTYMLHYEPGGSVPSFVIRAFQTSGVLDFVLNLRDYASSH